MDQRESFAAELIEKEVLRRGRRALVVFGQMHLVRQDLFGNFSSESLWLLPLLERQSSVRAFTIWLAANLQDVQPDTKDWPPLSLAFIDGTRLGAASFTLYYPHEVPRYMQQNGTRVLVPRSQWREAPAMEAQVDAILYMGSRSSLRRYTLSPKKVRRRRVRGDAPRTDAPYAAPSSGRIAEKQLLGAYALT